MGVSLTGELHLAIYNLKYNQDRGDKDSLKVCGFLIIPG